MASAEDSGIVMWEETAALCQAFVERPYRFAKATAEEREKEWKKIDGRYSKRLVGSILAVFKTCNSKRKAIQPIPTPKTTQQTYQPPSFRLRLSKDLQQHNVHCDQVLPPMPASTPIPVFCDTHISCSDFFLSPEFQYRLGRPFRLGIKFDENATIPNTVTDTLKLHPNLRQFAHSEQGTCICSCDDCTTDPNCKCMRLSKVLNRGNLRLKNETVYLNDNIDINCEEVDAMLIGCGLACKCYKHGKCEKNVDLLPLKQPSLEIFRNDLEMNFRVRTLSHLFQGNYIAEFTGHLETAEELDQEYGIDYAFQLVFDSSMNLLTERMIEGLRAYPEYKEFENIYNDLVHYKDRNKKLSDVFIQPYEIGNVAQFISHGCLPNCQIIRVMANHIFPQFHRLFIFASHHIQAGSELFISYGESYVKRMNSLCLCNTLLCHNGINSKYVASIKSEEHLIKFIRDDILPAARKASEEGYKSLQECSKLITTLENKPVFLRNLPIKEEPNEKKWKNKMSRLLVRERKKSLLELTAQSIELYPKTQEYQREVASHRPPRNEFKWLKIKREEPEIVEVFSTEVVTLDASVCSPSPRRACAMSMKIINESKVTMATRAVTPNPRKKPQKESFSQDYNNMTPVYCKRTLDNLRRIPRQSYAESPILSEKAKQRKRRRRESSTSSDSQNKVEANTHFLQKKVVPINVDTSNQLDDELSSLSNLSSLSSETYGKRSEEPVEKTEASENMVGSPSETTAEEGQSFGSNDVEVVKKTKRKRSNGPRKIKAAFCEQSETEVNEEAEKLKRKPNKLELIDPKEIAARKEKSLEQKKIMEAILPSKPLIFNFKIPKKISREVVEDLLITESLDNETTSFDGFDSMEPLPLLRFKTRITSHRESTHVHETNSVMNNAATHSSRTYNEEIDDNDVICLGDIFPVRRIEENMVYYSSEDVSWSPPRKPNLSIVVEYSPESIREPVAVDYSHLSEPYEFETEEAESPFDVSCIPLPPGPPPPFAEGRPFADVRIEKVIMEESDLDKSEQSTEEKEEADRQYAFAIEKQQELDRKRREKIEEENKRRKERKALKREKARSRKRHRRSQSLERRKRSSSEDEVEEIPPASRRSSREGSCVSTRSSGSIEWLDPFPEKMI